MVDERPEINAYQRCTASLNAAIENFPEPIFNQVPSDGGWSAAMVADHLLQVDKRMDHILATPADRGQRAADEKLQIIRDSLQNREVKLKAPSFLVPKTETLNKDSVLSLLKMQQERFLKHAMAANPDELCSAFPHHRLGVMTKLEWTWFTVYHTERHIIQIKEIQKDLQDWVG